MRLTKPPSVQQRMSLNQFILTPFFLDEPCPGLKSLAGPNWILNEPPLPNGDKPARIAAVNQRLAQLVSRAVSGGRRPVSIAGDCMSAIGVLAGLDVTSIPENKPPCGDHGSAA